MEIMERKNRAELRRVVVTGLGVVSPNGLGADAYRNSLRRGVSGIATISAFDPSRLSCRVAGEVKDINLDALLEPRELKRTGRAVHLAIAICGVLLVRGFKVLLQRVDHDVADEANAFARNAFGEQVFVCIG